MVIANAWNILSNSSQTMLFELLKTFDIYDNNMYSIFHSGEFGSHSFIKEAAKK